MDHEHDAEPAAAVDRSSSVPPGLAAHRAALLLAESLHSIGIEITSVREDTSGVGETGVRVGVLLVEDVMTLCGLLRAEEARRAAEALAALREGLSGE